LVVGPLTIDWLNDGLVRLSDTQRALAELPHFMYNVLDDGTHDVDSIGIQIHPDHLQVVHK